MRAAASPKPGPKNKAQTTPVANHPHRESAHVPPFLWPVVALLGVEHGDSHARKPVSAVSILLHARPFRPSSAPPLMLLLLCSAFSAAASLQLFLCTCSPGLLSASHRVFTRYSPGHRLASPIL
jgi:hypothetical protein